MFETPYRERGSASDPDRPELGRLMQAARDGQIDVVVVCDHGRLSRDPSAMRQPLGRRVVSFRWLPSAVGRFERPPSAAGREFHYQEV